MISKIKKPVSILLVFMMIVSLFTIVPLSAGAAKTYETLDLSQHYSDGLPESFTSEHFSVNVTSIDGSFWAIDDNCWQFDGDYPEDEANALISALSGETITKLVVHRLNWSDNTLIVKANGNSVSYTQSPISEDVSDFTYENINASEVKLFANPYYDSSGYCYVSSIDVYYDDPAPDPDPEPETIDIDFDASNAEVIWDDSTADRNIWGIAAYSADPHLSVSLMADGVDHAAGTYTIGEVLSAQNCRITDIDRLY